MFSKQKEVGHYWHGPEATPLGEVNAATQLSAIETGSQTKYYECDLFCRQGNVAKQHLGRFYNADRFYFAISNGVLPSSFNLHVFSIDDVLVYEKFYDDFGPFNLAQVYKYCRKVNKKLKASALSNNRIVHCTSTEITKRTNAAFLVGCYQIIYLNRSAGEAYKHLLLDRYRTFAPYRDASSGPSYYDLHLSDCLRAVQKAVRFGFLDFDNFDLEDYEYNEKVENGDLSWIVPNKFIAFSGPHTRTMIDNGYPMHAPEFYLPYFRKNNVTNVIRLNQKMYESHRFTRAGIAHHELFFPDGTVPTKAITLQFLDICETAPGAIAVHCKAGLGRTGTLIGCYLMKHYYFTAPEAIAWIRICRPGSIIGQQQNWLEEQQAWCWEEGRRERREKSPSPLPSRRRKDLIDADVAANHLSRPIGKVIYINTDPLKLPTQLRDDPVLRLAGLDNDGDTSQTPLSTTSSTNDQVEVLISSRPRVYHHKVQIAGRSQSPPAYGTGGEESNESNEPRYSPGPSREVNAMDLSQKPSTYKATFTQGDQLNRIKVIRKRNKQRKDGTGKDINIPSTAQHLASSYPRAALSGSVGDESGSALDFREIYNLHDEVTEDGSTTVESSDVEACNRFCYGSGGSQLPSMFYHNVTSSPPNGSKDRVGIPNGDSIDIQPSMTATLSSRNSLSSSYPRPLTPVNLAPAAVTARTPSESNVRALRGRGITTRGRETQRETKDGGTGGAGISGSNIGMGLPRTGITTTLPISASCVSHQNSRMPTVTG
ncbi:Dual specificity protein phosphatase CDC14A, partial [Taenia solium]